MKEARPRPVRFADLGLRLASGLVLAAIALIDLWAGGAWAAAFLAVVLVLMLWEYHRMVTRSDAIVTPALAVAAVAGVVALAATAIWGTPTGLALPRRRRGAGRDRVAALGGLAGRRASST